MFLSALCLKTTFEFKVGYKNSVIRKTSELFTGDMLQIQEKKKKKVDWQSKWVYYFFLKKDVVIIIDVTSLLSKKYRMYAKLKSDIHIRSNVLAVRNLSNCKRSEPGKEPKKGRPKLKNPAFYRNLSRNIWINVFKKEEKMLLIVL